MNDKRLNSAEFTQFFEDVLQPDVARSEELIEQYDKAMMKVKPWRSLFFLLSCLFLIFYFIPYILQSIAFALILFIVLFINFIQTRKKEGQILKQQKENAHYNICKHSIYPNVFRFYYADALFKPYRSVPQKVILESMLPNATKVKGDIVELPNQKLVICETFPNGVFIVAELNKTHNNRVLLLSKSSLGMFDTVKSHGIIQHKNLVKLESAEFDDNFEVYSDSQVFARYLLTPNVMLRILDYQEKIGEAISLSIVGNRLFAKVHLKEKLFEFPLFDHRNRFETIRKHAEYYFHFSTIVTDINLNN